MSLETIAFWSGTVSLILILLIKLYMIVDIDRWTKYGRASSAWFMTYIFFVLVLRFLFGTNPATVSTVRIVSGFSTVLILVCSILTYGLLKSQKDGDVKDF